jgi:enoyl-CoA hydratase/carnithine racemase
MSLPLPTLVSSGQVLAQQQGGVGVITLNRPGALHALSLPMVRDITALLLHWRHLSEVHTVLLQATVLPGKTAAFCAGGDIRFFHQAALAGDPTVEDFFTEEYTLNHLIHTYGKPVIALMDGITMGGGMGLAQGATLRVATERSVLAMPETLIGLFPDVGGGWFLAHCPGHVGEYLALTGRSLGAFDAMAVGLADVCVASSELQAVQATWAAQSPVSAEQALAVWHERAQPREPSMLLAEQAAIDPHFVHSSALAIVQSLEACASAWAQQVARELRQRSPLMLEVTLQQVRRERAMGLADALRQERGLVRHCLQLRPGAASETMEGIRALAIDKDRSPRWNPPRLEEVAPEAVAAFFESPWPAHAHPLANLGRSL